MHSVCVHEQPLLSLVVATSHCFHRFDTRVALDEVSAPTMALYNARGGWLATVVGPSVLTYDARTAALIKEHYEARPGDASTSVGARVFNEGGVACRF